VPLATCQEGGTGSTSIRRILGEEARTHPRAIPKFRFQLLHPFALTPDCLIS
jgi:hypothetical protein